MRKQRHVPMTQVGQKVVEVPQLEYIDQVIEVPRQKQVRVPWLPEPRRW